MIELFQEGFRNVPFHTLLTYIGVYLFSPIVVYFQIEADRKRRKRRGLPSLGHYTVRAIAFLLTFCYSAFIGMQLGDLPWELARDHAVNIAIGFPVAIWAAKTWLKRSEPQAVESFGEDLFETTFVAPKKGDGE